jgi:transglutaminase-like putative cysteine protease
VNRTRPCTARRPGFPGALLLLALLLPPLAGTGCGERLSRWGRAIAEAPGRVIGSNDPRTPEEAREALHEEGQRTWFVVELGGDRRAHGYRVRRRSTYNGQPAIITDTVQITQVVRSGRRFETEVERKAVTAIDGAALYFQETTETAGQRRVKTVTIRKGQAFFEETGSEGTKRSSIHVPRGVMFGIEPDYLLSRGLEPGRTFTATVLDRGERELVKETATVIGQERREILGQPMDVWVVETRRGGGIPVRMVFTRDGALVRLEAEEMVVRVVPKTETEAEAPVAEIVTTVSTSFRLPAWDNYAELVYALEPAAAWRPNVETNAYAEVREETGRDLRVALRRVMPSINPPELPLRVPTGLETYLGRAPNVWPDQADIAQRAREIVRGERDALSAVARLAGWVHQEIRWNARNALNMTPLQTMESRRGDCTEHADLFASLARAVGIPTRRCQGLLIQEEQAVYHAWVEVALDGQWIPVDTTQNRVGLAAGYLLTGRAGPEGEIRDDLPWTMRKENLHMRLLSASQVHDFGGGRSGTYTLVPGEKRTYVAQGPDGRWLANLYWGFAIERPEDWGGRAEMDLVELKSPDGAASVKCEALPARFRVSEGALDTVIQKLQDNLSGFELNDARLIRFGQPYAWDALLVDFTTRQGGVALRCRQFIVPKRGRSYRISAWAPAGSFEDWMPLFDRIFGTITL